MVLSAASSRSYAALCLAAFLWLGLWLKFIFHLFHPSALVEPIGAFDGSVAQYDMVMLASGTAFFAAALAFLLAPRFAPMCTIPLGLDTDRLSNRVAWPQLWTYLVLFGICLGIRADKYTAWHISGGHSSADDIAKAGQCSHQPVPDDRLFLYHQLLHSLRSYQRTFVEYWRNRADHLRRCNVLIPVESRRCRLSSNGSATCPCWNCLATANRQSVAVISRRAHSERR